MDYGSPFMASYWYSLMALHWRHNDHDGVSNHQSHGCLLNRLFRRIAKQKSKLRVTGLCVGNSPGPVNSPHKGPVTRKMFPFDDVIIDILTTYRQWHPPGHVLYHSINMIRQIGNYQQLVANCLSFAMLCLGTHSSTLEICAARGLYYTAIWHCQELEVTNGNAALNWKLHCHCLIG